jgi:sulfatase maturation enzyme AslB (radical SAM superfamily)
MIPSPDIFCSSPWLHLRIRISGQLQSCRWMNWQLGTPLKDEYIQNTSMIEYFNSVDMCALRGGLLSNTSHPMCAKCYYQDSFNKVSGRVRQLFRSKLDNLDTFADDFVSSPHIELFNYSLENNFKASKYPIDLQIDLENTCNGACIMCNPVFSSKLGHDFKKLHVINPKIFPISAPQKNWAADPVTLAKFVDEIKQMPEIEYIHFLGGETLYVESFYTICEALIKSGAAKNIIMGTTTNCSIYSDRLANIISSFKSVHLGLSIESMHEVNDYIRYPSKIGIVSENIKNFLALRENNHELYIQFRITPNIFTVFYLDELLQYALDNGISSESCDILCEPPYLCIELIPNDIKMQAISKLKNFMIRNKLMYVGKVTNSREKSLCREVMADAVTSYINFLETMQPPTNCEDLRFGLVEFLHAFETIRKNSILDYVPEFTDFLMQYGYSRQK